MGNSSVERVRRPQSLTALVTDQIRDLISTRQDRLGRAVVGRRAGGAAWGQPNTPVREAFQRLEMERLVEIRPQRGTYVFEYDLTILREICELREILETGAFRQAIARGGRGLASALQTRLEEAEAALAQGPAGYQAYDSAFHEALVRASENREIIDAYLMVGGTCSRHTLSHYADHGTDDQRAEGPPRNHRSDCQWGL